MWESSDWAGARVTPNITCLTWAPTSISDVPHPTAVAAGVPDDAPSTSALSTTASKQTLTAEEKRCTAECEDEYGWLGCGSQNGTIGITRTKMTTSGRTRNGGTAEANDRNNFNLRGHSTPITLAVWNRSPLKLATCDESGMIYVWVPYEERWSVELVNERGTKVRDFCWSPTGHAALIVYEDNFVLIGSATGNRIWSHHYERLVTSGVWSPDSRQVILGTETGVALVLSEQGIQVMETRGQHPEHETNYCSTLCATFSDGHIYLLRTHDDVDPVVRKTNLTDMTVRWSLNGEFLAVVGTKPPLFRPKEDGTSHSSLQLLIYDWTGTLRQRSDVAFDTTVSAQLACFDGEEESVVFTWAHNDKAIVLARGGQVRVARVLIGIASLSTLCSYALWSHLGANGTSRPERIARLPLPHREKAHVSEHNGHMVECRVPDEETLIDECCVGSEWRWYCTIKPMGTHGKKEGGAFILYMEHMGGLIPILAGKLTNRLLPEFTIQLYYNRTTSNQARSSIGSPPHTPRFIEDISRDSSRTNIRKWSSSHGECDDSATMGGDVASTSTNTPSPFVRAGQTTRSLASRPADLSTPESTTTPRSGRSSELWRRSKRQWKALTTRTPPPQRAVSPRHVHLTWQPSSESSTASGRLEDRLVLVSSNVWCTRFKVVGMAPERLSSWLGQVTYKTSVLHLQPRQMTVHVVDMRHRQALGPLVLPPISTLPHAVPLCRAVDETSAIPRLRDCTELVPVAPTHNELFVARDTQHSREQGNEQRMMRSARDLVSQLADELAKSTALVREYRRRLDEDSIKFEMEAAVVRDTQLSAMPRRRSSPTTEAETADSWSMAISHFEFIDDDDTLIIPEGQALDSMRARTLSDYVQTPALETTKVPRSAWRLMSRLRKRNHAADKSMETPVVPRAPESARVEVSAPRANPYTGTLEETHNLLEQLAAMESSMTSMHATHACPPSTSTAVVDVHIEKSNEGLPELDEQLSAIARSAVALPRVLATEHGVELHVGPALVAKIESIQLGLHPQSTSIAREDETRGGDEANNNEALLTPICMSNRKANVIRSSIRRTRLFGTGDAVSAAEPKPTAASMAMQHTPDADHVLVLQNKTPFWNEQSQVYQLDFGGRVTQESAKNFQIEHNETQVMQFGRIENGAYTLDFQAPFSAVQAFAVALASITQRLK